MAAGDVTSSIQTCGSNGAVYQDTPGDYIKLANYDAYDITDQITLSIWIMKNGANGAVIYEGIFGRYIDFAIMYKNSTDQLRVYGSNTTGWGGEVIIIGPPGNFDDDNWHHIAVTYDGTTTIMYYDGSEIANSTSLSGDIKQSSHFSGWTAGYYQGLVNASLIGYLKDAKIFDRCLTASEVDKLSKGGNVERNLIGEWKFNSDANDTSGYSNNATISGGEIVIAPNDDENGSNVDQFFTNSRVTANDIFLMTSLAEKDKLVLVNIEEAP